jgi:hypothetical protein
LTDVVVVEEGFFETGGCCLDFSPDFSLDFSFSFDLEGALLEEEESALFIGLTVAAGVVVVVLIEDLALIGVDGVFGSVLIVLLVTVVVAPVVVVFGVVGVVGVFNAVMGNEDFVIGVNTFGFKVAEEDATDAVVVVVVGGAVLSVTNSSSFGFLTDERAWLLAENGEDIGDETTSCGVVDRAFVVVLFCSCGVVVATDSVVVDSPSDEVDETEDNESRGGIWGLFKQLGVGCGVDGVDGSFLKVSWK